MGMAASQARFLGLTARKSNVEYEGQQVNQERASLANEAANLYGQLQKLDVPTPPSTSDFYRLEYQVSTNQFSNDGGYQKYGFTEIIQTPDGYYVDLSYSETKWQVLAGKGLRGSIQEDADITHKFGEKYDKSSTSNSIFSGLMFQDKPIILVPLSEMDSSVLEGLQESNADGKDHNIITISDGSEGNKEQYIAYVYGEDGPKYLDKEYFKANDDGIVIVNPDNKFQLNPNLNDDNISGGLYAKGLGKTTATQHMKSVKVTNFVQADNGRISEICLEDGTSLKVECKSVEDEEAYNQAMLDYEYEKNQYDKKIADINSKTEEIHSEDKVLEMNLKQLDTEQNAIKTEMDAVQKVIKDNTESTFKTFG